MGGIQFTASLPPAASRMVRGSRPVSSTSVIRAVRERNRSGRARSPSSRQECPQDDPRRPGQEDDDDRGIGAIPGRDRRRLHDDRGRRTESPRPRDVDGVDAGRRGRRDPDVGLQLTRTVGGRTRELDPGGRGDEIESKCNASFGSKSSPVTVTSRPAVTRSGASVMSGSPPPWARVMAGTLRTTSARSAITGVNRRAGTSPALRDSRDQLATVSRPDRQARHPSCM